ncbi:hypothetical protein ACET3Z_014647 [Daucus carota]
MSDEGGKLISEPAVWQFSANGVCIKADTIEEKLDAGNVEDSESSLCEKLMISSEEAKILLGRLQYQRGKVESALRIINGADLQAAIQKIPPTEKQPPKKGRPRSESGPSQHPATLLLEGRYIKAKCLQKLGKTRESAQECGSLLDAVEKIFPQGVPDTLIDSKLQETISHAAELLPQLSKLCDSFSETITAYRRALVNQLNLENGCCARIQKDFAVLLLYCGVDVTPPTADSTTDGPYVPRNSFEEAILLLMLAMRNFQLSKARWDPSVIEHLTYALSLCSQTSVLAKQLEEIMPGLLHRVERWKLLSLCFGGSGHNETAINLLRKCLHKHENPDDIVSLLLAAKICSEDNLLAAEGVGYARRAINNAHGLNKYLEGVSLRVLSLCLAKQSKVSLSDYERSRLQSEALKSLDKAVSLDPNNSELIFDLGVQYAEHRNLNAALHYAKKYVDITGGSILKGWRLLVLVLSAQQRFSEAQVVTDAALDETAKWDQGTLLRMKAKLKTAQSLHKDAIESYSYLLALVQAQKKSQAPLRNTSQDEGSMVNEYDVWHGLSTLYASLFQWKDAEVCLGKAKELVEYSAETLYAEGIMCETRGEVTEALAAYVNALMIEPCNVPCKILLGALLPKMGTKWLASARTILSDALRIEPTNRMAWYQLALVHRDDGRLADAAECFQAATMLEESDPIESFSSVL